jgi:TfoX/Sxy family transcriptional regulator of competence genes
MATTQDFMNYVAEQADLGARLSTRKMFGEYALYVDGKVVALVCDNAVFLKPTDAAKRRLGDVLEATPYPGAKLHSQVNEQLDDRELFKALLLLTASELPIPKPRSKPRSKPTPKRVSKSI